MNKLINNIIQMEVSAIILSVIELPNEAGHNLICHALSGIENNYPPCCIIEFCEDLGKGNSPGRLRALNGDGFIPCRKHYRIFKSQIDNLHTLRVKY